MKAPVLEPKAERPHRHLHLVRPFQHHAHEKQQRRSTTPPGWILVTIVIALIAAVVAGGIVYMSQQARVGDAKNAQQQAVAALAVARDAAAAALHDARTLNDRVVVQGRRAAATQARVTRLQRRVHLVQADLARSQASLNRSQARVAHLRTVQSTLETKLQHATKALRTASAGTAALIGPPMADGRYAARFEAFGGLQSPPFAVVDLQQSSDWRVVPVSQTAVVHVLGKHGSKRVTLAQFNNMFAAGSSRPNNIAKATFRIAARNGTITAISELHG